MDIPAVEIDLADLRCHVVVRRKSGFIKCIRFTPGKSKDFVRAGKSALRAARGGQII